MKHKEKDESRFSNVQGSHMRNGSLGTVLDSLACCPDSSPPCHPFQVWRVHSPCCWDYWWLTGCSWFPPHLPPQYCPVDGNHPTVHITPLPCCNPHGWCLLPWPNQGKFWRGISAQELLLGSVEDFMFYRPAFPFNQSWFFFFFFFNASPFLSSHTRSILRSKAQ